MAGEPQEHDADDVDEVGEADGPFAALVDDFDGPSTAFPDLDYLVILAGVTVVIFLVGFWGYSVLS